VGDIITLRIRRRNPLSSGQVGKLHAAGCEEWVGRDKKGIGAFARKGGKDRIDLAARTGFENLDL
jgi:hypothetical protein